MKKIVASLVAATLLSLGAAFAQETKPAAPATSSEKTTTTEKTTTEKTTTPKKHTTKKHKKSTKKSTETKTEGAAPATSAEAPKK